MTLLPHSEALSRAFTAAVCVVSSVTFTLIYVVMPSTVSTDLWSVYGSLVPAVPLWGLLWASLTPAAVLLGRWALRETAVPQPWLRFTIVLAYALLLACSTAFLPWVMMDLGLYRLDYVTEARIGSEVRFIAMASFCIGIIGMALHGVSRLAVRRTTSRAH